MKNTEFQVTFADVTIDVTAVRGHTKEYCRTYLTNRPQSHFSLELTPEIIADERSYTIDTAIRTGRPPMGVPSDDAMELQAFYRRIVARLLEYGVLMLHSSAICVDGRAYLFSAPSGTGKSTHTGLWMEMLGGEGNGRSFIINDDKPFLRFTDHGLLVYGSPWVGKGGTHTNARVPLEAVCLLRRAKENRIRRLAPAEAETMLWQDFYHPEGKEAMEQTLRLLQRTLRSVPLYLLSCNADPEAAQVSFDAMVHGGSL